MDIELNSVNMTNSMTLQMAYYNTTNESGAYIGTVSPISIVGNHSDLEDISVRFQSLLRQPHQLIGLLLSLCGILLNLLSLCALTQVKIRMSTHFRLIISLAISDIIIGVSVMMYIMNRVWFHRYPPGAGPWSARLQYRCTFMFVKCLNTVGLASSLLNLMGMAIDHFVAILKPLQYPSIMEKRKMSGMICCMWAIAIFTGISDFFSGFNLPAALYKQYNYCEIVWMTEYNDEFLVFAMAFLCLITMLVIYIKIYLKINQRQSQNIGESNGGAAIGPKNRTPLITTLLILGSFVLCWLPMCIFQLTLITILKLKPDVLARLWNQLTNADQYLYDLLLLNCIVDPIIYAVRMCEVQLGYRRLFSRLGLCKYTGHSTHGSNRNRYLYRSTISSERHRFSYDPLLMERVGITRDGSMNTSMTNTGKRRTKSVSRDNSVESRQHSLKSRDASVKSREVIVKSSETNIKMLDTIVKVNDSSIGTTLRDSTTKEVMEVDCLDGNSIESSCSTNAKIQVATGVGQCSSAPESSHING